MTVQYHYSFMFYLRAFWRDQPKLFVLTVGACLIAIFSALFCVERWQQASAALQQLAIVQAQVRPAVTLKETAELSNKAVELPQFNGAELVDLFNQVASDVGMPADEVSYALEGASAQPFLRYRVTLTVVSNYPLVRRFVEQLGMNLPNSSLDSISCTREDITQAALSCDLAFSVFFRSAVRG